MIEGPGGRGRWGPGLDQHPPWVGRHGHGFVLGQGPSLGFGLFTGLGEQIGDPTSR